MNKKKKSPRRTPSRDEKYMALAMWIASFSKDPDTQIGAVIISAENKPLGWGYNGPPRQIKDIDVNWDRPDKYDFVEHAEENAIDHSGFDLEGSILYVTAKPCKKCMLKIVKQGIHEVIYFPFKSKDKLSSINDPATYNRVDEISRLGNVQLKEFNGNLNWMRDRMQHMETIGVFG